jgi:thiamine biosynthesis lipoprotein
MKTSSIGFVIFLVVFLLVSAWRYNHLRQSPSDSVERTRILMDTLVRIEVFGGDEHRAQEAMERAFGEMERLSGVFSHYRPDSEVSGINRHAGESPNAVSEDLYAVLQRTLHFAQVTKGAFDITIGAVSQLWDFAGEEPQIPSADEVRKNIELVRFQHLLVDEGKTAFLTEKGMAIDLGGAAKGYSVDRAVAVLRQEGVFSGLVDAGGDIGLLGRKADDQPWRIGVQHPRDATELIAVLEVDSGSVATSGDYQRFFFQEGQRYHHILDPETGWPSRGCVSVTIVTREAMDADILATGVFALGPQKGLALIEHLNGVEGLIFFERDGRIEHVLSKGLQDRIEFK